MNHSKISSTDAEQIGAYQGMLIDGRIFAVPTGTVGVDTWAPGSLVTEGRLTIDGISVRLEMYLTVKRGKWTVDWWKINVDGFDYEPFYTRNEEGKVSAVDLTGINAEIKRQIPEKVANKAYYSLLKAVREWSAAHADEMREMQRSSFCGENEIIKRTSGWPPKCYGTWQSNRLADAFMD